MDRGAVGILTASGDPAPSIFHSDQSANGDSGHWRTIKPGQRDGSIHV